MRIGLLRHFPVSLELPTGWCTAGQLQAWRERYDATPASPGEFDLGGISWGACVSSMLARARVTASTVYSGPIEYTALLREAEFATFQTGGLRLPIWTWRWLLRFTWMTGHKSQRACRDDFHRRVLAMADQLSGMKRDTLVVSHAGVMMYLSAELRRRGFAGPKLRMPKHAHAHIYERPDSKSVIVPKQTGAARSAEVDYVK